MEELVEVKYVVLIAIQYGFSFFVFGWIARGWYKNGPKTKEKE